MRILFLAFLIGSCVHAMDRNSQMLRCDEIASPPLSKKITKAGNSVLDFFKSIPATVKEVIPVLQDSSGSEEESYSTSSSPELPRLESPPKKRLEQVVYLGRPIIEGPTVFQVHNRAAIGVLLIAVVTAPYAPKKYFLQPNHTIMSMSPHMSTFQEIIVPSDGMRHSASYEFKDSLYVRLLIQDDRLIEGQLRICKKTE